MVNTAKQAIGYIVTGLCHALIIAFVVYTLYLIIDRSAAPIYLKCHICLMTFGFGALMSEAIMSITQDNLITTKISRKTRVTMHWMLQILAIGCILSGFIIVIVWKADENIPHFKSPHSIVGLTAIICSCLATFGGIAAFFSVKLKNYMKPVVAKLLHNIGGEVGYLLGIVTLILGLYTAAFINSATHLAQILCTIALVIVGLASVFSPVIAAYDKLKTIFR